MIPHGSTPTFNNVFLLDGVDNISYSNSFRGENVQLVQPSINGYPSGLLDPGAIAQTVGRRAQDANQRTPYIQQYNIGAQYELRPDLVLDVAFVGNKGTKLNGFRNLNQRAVITNADGSQSAGARPYPNFGDIQWMENRVSSTYKSLQTRLEKRFSKGLSGLVSYTWGEALNRGAGSHIDERRRPGLRYRRIPRTAGRQQSARLTAGNGRIIQFGLKFYF